MATMPTRIDGDLFAAAKTAGILHSRSAAQQIDHWARIGRELEASAKVTTRDIEAVLAGDGAYDALAEREQAIVRAAWEERLTRSLADMDLAQEFSSNGLAYAEADADGGLIVHEPNDA